MTVRLQAGDSFSGVADVCQGQVGTVIEVLGDGEAFEVEFADREGQTYAIVAITAKELMVLRYEPMEILAAS